MRPPRRLQNSSAESDAPTPSRPIACRQQRLSGISTPNAAYMFIKPSTGPQGLPLIEQPQSRLQTAPAAQETILPLVKLIIAAG